MKFFPVGLCVVISAIAISQSAYANQADAPTTNGEGNHAAALMTAPATINSNWNGSKQTTQPVVVLREQGCKKINPLDLIKNPAAFFEQCQSPTNSQNQQSSDPVDYLKVPKLDSGVNLRLTEF
jgi:hypothetical protein